METRAIRLGSDGDSYLFYIAEDEISMGKTGKTKEEAYNKFISMYGRKPDRVLGIFEINKKKAMGKIVWENFDFLVDDGKEEHKNE